MLRKLWPLLLIAFIILTVLHVHYYADYQTTLLPGVHIQDGASDLKANHWSVPVVFDWDSDGKKDLLIGNSYTDEGKVRHGYISFYKNTGADPAPSFDGFIYLQTCDKECSPLNTSAFG
ncbi:MAG: hypothetical protein HZB61_14775 [Nitrospirae bacterium]|nr:hypothetical protein [Nitrospirota bacterium]